MLVAHVVEHMPYRDAVELVRSYSPYVAGDGKFIFICPQEAGYRSDPTHVEFADFDALRRLAAEVGVTVTRAYSFPMPRPVGRWFRYNEFVVVARR